ncbi:MAG: RNA polymerase sigma factor [Eubacterium sp.]|nr:RNA polymerase sigma factor [Eubacterium sp.]
MQVFSYIMTLAKNRDMAEEITQNTFYKAIARGGYKGDSDELTWLCSIAKNLFYDEMRRQKRFTDKEPKTISDNSSPQQKAEDKDAAIRIHIILHTLDEPYKEVFQLRVFGELSFTQIGKIFGKTESWARVTYHRARLKIRERMDEQ